MDITKVGQGGHASSNIPFKRYLVYVQILTDLFPIVLIIHVTKVQNSSYCHPVLNPTDFHSPRRSYTPKNHTVPNRAPSIRAFFLDVAFSTPPAPLSPSAAFLVPGPPMLSPNPAYGTINTPGRSDHLAIS